MFGLFKRYEDVPTPEPVEREMPDVANPEPSALELTSSAHCRACTNGLGDGCCAYHHEKWSRTIERLDHIIEHQS
jgi:hypothetical protein